MKEEVKAQKKLEADLLFCRNLHSSQRGMTRSQESKRWLRAPTEMLKSWPDF